MRSTVFLADDQTVARNRLRPCGQEGYSLKLITEDKDLG